MVYLFLVTLLVAPVSGAHHEIRFNIKNEMQTQLCISWSIDEHQTCLKFGSDKILSSQEEWSNIKINSHDQTFIELKAWLWEDQDRLVATKVWNVEGVADGTFLGTWTISSQRQVTSTPKPKVVNNIIVRRNPPRRYYYERYEVGARVGPIYAGVYAGVGYDRYDHDRYYGHDYYPEHLPVYGYGDIKHSRYAPNPCYNASSYREAYACTVGSGREWDSREFRRRR